MADPLPWIDTEDLLTATGARNLSRSGNEFSFSCMSGNHSHGDSSPSAGMNATTSLWQCHSPACGLRGNAAEYLMALKNYTHSEAMRILQERYGGPEVSAEPGALEAEIERIRASRSAGEEETRIMLTEDEYLDRFGLHWPDGAGPGDLPEPMAYMLRRGFSAATLNKFDIGFDDMSDRITIPVYDERGELVGIKGRAWNTANTLRYLSIGDVLGRLPRYGFHTYHKSQHVFGLYRLRDGGSPVVVEGELNVLALDQLGIDAVAVAGAEFSDRQAELIISRCRSVVLFFDDDAAGISGTRKVSEALHPYMPVKVVRGATGDAADALEGEFDVASLIVDAIPVLTTTVLQ